MNEKASSQSQGFDGLKRLKKLVQILRSRPDSEHEQALVRLVAGVIVSVFALVEPSCSALSPAGLHTLMIVFLSGCLFIFLDILRSPAINPPRRIAGILFDTGFATFFLSYSREAGIPLVVLYLWMIVGNGFRYGPFYLMLSTALSAGGLTVVSLVNPLWKSEPGLYAAFLLTILLHPLYTLSMIRKLRAAAEAAQAASRAKSQFLANVSHELRTPLAGVIGIGDLLEKTRPTPEQRSLLRLLSASARSLKGLIENVLEMSKIEAGRVVVLNDPLNLFRLVDESVRTIAPLAHEKRLHFYVRYFESAPPMMVGDARLLRQILVNLLGNAVKFTERGEVVLTVSRRSKPEEKGGTIRFEVKDTGIGMSKEVQSHLFTRFVQGDARVTRKYGGTGLGTSIAKEMVEAMGGRIGFSSELGAGSRFWVEIPEGDLQGQASTDHDENVRKSPIRVLWADFSTSGTSLFERIPGSMIPTRLQEAKEMAAILARSRKDGVSFQALIIQSAQEAKDWDECRALLASSSVLDALPVIILEREASAPLSSYFGLGTSPRVPAFLPEDPDVLMAYVDAVVRENGFAHENENAQRRVPLSILVAEDNVVNRKVLSEILKAAGHFVVLAADGLEAVNLLELSEDGTFDVLILDYNMPDLGGLDVLEAYRHMHPVHQAATMILTAAVTREVEEACIAAGVEAFVPKPVDTDRFLDTLSRIARPSRGKDRPSSTALDEAVIERLFRFSPHGDFLKDLLTSFRSDGFRLVSEMEEAVKEKDHGKFLELAHALKGSALQMGALRLSEACSRIGQCRTEEMEKEGLRARMREVTDAFEEILDLLDDQVGAKDPSRTAPHSFS